MGFVCGVNSRGNGEGWRLGSHGPGWHSPRPPAICVTPGKCPALSEPQHPDEHNETVGSEASSSDPFLVSVEEQDPVRSRC